MITLQAKGFTSMTHYNLVHKFLSDASSDVNSGCQSSSGQGMEEARDSHSLAVGKSEEQKGGCSRSTRRQKASHFATLMDICHLKNADLERKLRQSRAPR